MLCTFSDSTEGLERTETDEAAKHKSPDDEHEVNQTTAPLYSSLQPVDLSQHVADMYEDKIISMAPGEKHTPIPALKHESQSFPYLFIDGSRTFFRPQKYKINFKKIFQC